MLFAFCADPFPTVVKNIDFTEVFMFSYNSVFESSALSQDSIVTLLVFAGGFGLLAPLHTGTFIMLSLPNLSQNAGLRTAALKTLQRTVDGFVFLHMNLRHLYFPPSEASGSIQDALRAILYGFNKLIIQIPPKLVKRIS